MHGYYKSSLIYGILDNNKNIYAIIDIETLSKKFPNVKIFAYEINNYYLKNAIYGIECTIDNTNGLPIISENNKTIVNNLYDKICKYKKKRMEELPKLGFYNGIDGFFENEYYKYDIFEYDNE